MRVLVTGIAGFVGRHLAGSLCARGYQVFGIARRSGAALRIEGVPSDQVLLADVEDAASVEAAVRTARPAALFHLAGLTKVSDSYADPGAVFRANVLGTINVLASVRKTARECRVVVVGSGEAYGRVEGAGQPLDETCAWRPVTPYGASKAAADLVAYQWAQADGLDIVRMRPFNHTGPGQRPGFVCTDLARQLVAIERGMAPARMAVGALHPVRDFSDVRDIVSGYLTALEGGKRGEAYNLCSGVGRSIRSVLDDVIALSTVQVEVVVDPEKLRPAEADCLVGSAAKFHAATGWRTEIPWRQTLADLLADWRSRPDAALIS